MNKTDTRDWPNEPGAWLANYDGHHVECFAFHRGGKLVVVTNSGDVREQDDKPNLKQFWKPNLLKIRLSKKSA